MANRIDACFERLRAQKKKAFVAYLTGGDPHLDVTPDLVWALERAGADVVELGVPFSDPLADGPVNQLAAARALASGATLAGWLRAVEKIRSRSSIPLVAFTYLNPLLRYGLDRFCADALQAGVDGVLFVDLPPQERARLAGWSDNTGLHAISLIAPTTPESRLAALAQASGGFVYYVSREGVTGMQPQHFQDQVGENVDRLRAHTKLPICVGFGISNPAQAGSVAKIADGVVVGSVLVNHVAEHGAAPDLATKLETFARGFADAIHAA